MIGDEALFRALSEATAESDDGLPPEAARLLREDPGARRCYDVLTGCEEMTLDGIASCYGDGAVGDELGRMSSSPGSSPRPSDEDLLGALAAAAGTTRPLGEYAEEDLVPDVDAALADRQTRERIATRLGIAPEEVFEIGPTLLEHVIAEVAPDEGLYRDLSGRMGL